MFFSNFKRIPLSKLILILILVVALFLRTYHLEKSVWMQFGYDESRDMLVASHIIDNHEFISRGPLAAGGFNYLKNSPIYYYFIALIWFFTKSPTNFMFFYAVLMTLPVLMGYFIGKKALDTQTGIIFAGILAVNQQMISSSRELMQPYFLLLFSMGFIFSAVSFIKLKKHKLLHLNLMIFFVMFALHFHYGVFVALPASLVVIIYCWLELNFKTQIKSTKNLFSPIFLFMFLFLLWIMLTYTNYPFDQIYFFILNSQHRNNLTFLEQSTSVFITLRQMIWGNYLFNYRSYSLTIILVVLLFSLSISYLKKFKINKNVFSFLIVMSSSVFLLGFYKRWIDGTYILFIFPFLMILLSIVLRFIIFKFKFLGCILTLTTILYFGFYSYKGVLENLPSVSYHQQQKEIAKEIYDHHIFLSQSDPRFLQPNLLVTWYTTAGIMPFEGWGMSGIIFYLEKYFDQNLVKNIDYGVNHEPLDKYPKIIYLICDHRINPDLVQQECLDGFVKLHPTLGNDFQSILCGEYLSVWSIRVNSSENLYIRHLVNPDLLND